MSPRYFLFALKIFVIDNDYDWQIKNVLMKSVSVLFTLEFFEKRTTVECIGLVVQKIRMHKKRHYHVLKYLAHRVSTYIKEDVGWMTF